MITWLSAIFGPVFAKELVERSRRPRYFLVRVLYVLVLSWTVGSQWGALADTRQRGSFGVHYAFTSVMVTQYFVLVLLVPLFLHGAIAHERERGSLILLFTTSLKDWQIVLGKLASGLAITLLLLFSSIPVMAIIALLGGIDYKSLLLVSLATLDAITYVAVATCYFSTTSKSATSALVRTYSWLVSLWVIVPIALFVLMGWLGINEATEHFLCAAVFYFEVFINPLLFLLLTTNTGTYSYYVNALGENFVYYIVAAHVLVIGILFWRAAWRLRDGTLEQRERGRSCFARAREARRRYRLWRAERRRRWAPTILGREIENPFWLRARQVLAYDREGQLRKLALGVWVVALFLFFFVVLQQTWNVNRSFSRFLLTSTWVVTWLAAGIYSSVGLAGDRQRGFLELTLATPLSHRTFVDGTLAAIFEHLRVMLFPPIGFGLLLVFHGSVGHYRYLLATGTGLLCCLVIAIIGMACSTVAKSTTEALLGVSSFVFTTLILEPLFREMSEIWFWMTAFILAISVFVGAGLAFRRGRSAVSLGLCLTSLYYLVGMTLSSWHFSQEDPGATFISPVDISSFPLLFEQKNIEVTGTAYLLLLTGWLTLIVYFFLVRFWLIRRFGVLARRT